MTIYCATTNPGKLREFGAAAAHFGAAFTVESLPGLAAIEPCEETGATFEENAIRKALYYGRYTGGYLFVDDSGLQVDALGGAPGVHSARFAGPEATDAANNALLLDRLREARDRTARFVCVVALARGGRLERTFHGEVEGRILHEPRGAAGFGYDPLFYYPPFGCSFGQAAPARKMSVSHRGQALRALFGYLSGNASTTGIR